VRAAAVLAKAANLPDGQAELPSSPPFLRRGLRGGLIADLTPTLSLKRRGGNAISLARLEKLLIRFPDIIERAHNEYAPQLVVNYLTNLASAFNSFYANQVIIDRDDPMSPYYVTLTQAFSATMTNGLWVLGIKVPRRM
jgi:arginyl-tRNA synthetase